MSEPQSYANHRRFDPWYHIVAFALLAVAFALAVFHSLHHPGNLWQVLISLGTLVAWTKIRSYALRVQDRVIRLEETLRIRALVPEPLQARIAELKPAQFVALRFAADGELATRMAETLDEGLTGEAIKKRIQTWRPDTFRV